MLTLSQLHATSYNN